MNPNYIMYMDYDSAAMNNNSDTPIDRVVQAPTYEPFDIAGMVRTEVFHQPFCFLTDLQ